MKHPQTNLQLSPTRQLLLGKILKSSPSLQFIDRTWPTPEQNLAFDEALLDACEGGGMGEALRFWEPCDYFVVVGYSGKIHEEVNRAVCQKQQIPILRRVSGGGTVLEGPGCLNFSLILHTNGSQPLKNLSETNAYILERHREALQPFVEEPIEIQGTSDLALGGLKFSGNAQRRKRRALLFHGTFLTQFDLSQIELFLPIPKKQPAYRKDRAHQDFLNNVPIRPEDIKKALANKWNAVEPFQGNVETQMERLVTKRYGNRSWNYKFE